VARRCDEQVLEKIGSALSASGRVRGGQPPQPLTGMGPEADAFPGQVGRIGRCWAVSSTSRQLLHEQRHRLAQEFDFICIDAARF
jgi:hypothetical protein